jgi:hypothetical protein
VLAKGLPLAQRTRFVLCPRSSAGVRNESCARCDKRDQAEHRCALACHANCKMVLTDKAPNHEILAVRSSAPAENSLCWTTTKTFAWAMIGRQTRIVHERNLRSTSDHRKSYRLNGFSVLLSSSCSLHCHRTHRHPDSIIFLDCPAACRLHSA